MSNFGIGAAAFMSGLAGGLGTGQQIRGIRDQRQIRKIREKGLEEARQQREQQVGSLITPVMPELPRNSLGEEVPQEGMKPTGYMVGDQSFASQEEARKAAEGRAPSIEDIFFRDTVPKIREAYLAQGNIEAAEGWEQYAESRRGKRAIKSWGKAFTAAQSGDWDAAATGFGEYYTNFIDDDVDYTGHETMKDEDGNVTGFKVKLKNRQTGKVNEMPMSTDDLISLGMAHNPQALFEQAASQLQTANEYRLKDARDARKFEREMGGRLTLEKAKAALKDEADQRKFDRSIDALRQAGYDSAFINRAMPSLLGIDASGPYKKGASPEEQARMLHQERMKDYRYRRLDPAEQRRIIEQDMMLIRDAADLFAGGERGANRPPAGQGLYVQDTQTGQIVPYR